jgi:hypothetical protein
MSGSVVVCENKNVLLGVEMIKMPKVRCVCTENLEAKYPVLKEDQQVGKVLCSICKSQF